MKKKNVINLIKYYSEDNDAGFRSEAYEIAKDFDRSGDCQLASYVLALLANVDTLFPQMDGNTPLFLEKMEKKGDMPVFPEVIMQDLLGIVHAAEHNMGINKFLLRGEPGTGKTEAVKQLARILGRDIYRVDTAAAVGIDSGQIQENTAALLKEINSFAHPEKVLLLIEQIDVPAPNGLNSDGVQDIGQLVSAMLKEIDEMDERLVLLASARSFEKCDQALISKFDSVIDFNRYTEADLMKTAEGMLNKFLKGAKPASKDIRLFRKIINLLSPIPYPGKLKKIIKTAVAFSNPQDGTDYFRRLYYGVCHKKPEDLRELQAQKFTLREIEILARKSKSSVARKLKEEDRVE